MIKEMITGAILSTALVAGGDIANIYQEPKAPLPCEQFQPYGYVGAAGVYAEFTEDFNGEEWTEDNIGGQLQGGVMLFGQNGWSFGAEGRVGSIELDYLDVTYYNIYAKVEKDVDKFGIYGLLGYGTTDFSATFDYGYLNVTIDDSVSDFTWGAGVKYAFNEQFDVFVDYVVLADYEVGTDTIDSDVVTLGVNYKFGGF
jgi:opacity protein-like surface antigen